MLLVLNVVYTTVAYLTYVLYCIDMSHPENTLGRQADPVPDRHHGHRLRTVVAYTAGLGVLAGIGDVYAYDGRHLIGGVAAIGSAGSDALDRLGVIDDGHENLPADPAGSARRRPLVVGTPQPPAAPSPSETPGTPPSPSRSAVPPAATPSETADSQAAQCIARMPLEYKLGQSLVVPVLGDGGYATKPASFQNTFDLLQQYHIGGVVITANPVTDPAQNVLKYKNAGLLVAVDHEGGQGEQKIIRIDTPVTAKMPSQRQVAETMTPEEAEAMAAEQYREIARYATVVLGPVVDVAPADGSEARIGTYRTFSSDPTEAARYTDAYLRGSKTVPNFSTTLKHLPGGGSMPHTDYRSGSAPSRKSQFDHDLKTLGLLEQPIGNIIVNSASIAPDDPSDPATSWSGGDLAVFSKEVVSGLVGGYNVQGMVFSDDIGAPGVVSTNPETGKKEIMQFTDSIPKAWAAGVTNVLWVQDGFNAAAPLDLETRLRSIIDAGEKAVADGKLSQEQVDANIARSFKALGIDPCQVSVG